MTPLTRKEQTEMTGDGHRNTRTTTRWVAGSCVGHRPSINNGAAGRMCRSVRKRAAASIGTYPDHLGHWSARHGTT